MRTRTSPRNQDRLWKYLADQGEKHAAVHAPVLTIIRSRLSDLKCTGLYRDGCGCGEMDLAPCDGIQHDCRPGHRRKCPACGQWFTGPEKQGPCPDCSEATA